MITAKKILISGAALAAIGIALFMWKRSKQPFYEDLAAETRPIIVTS